MSVLALSPELLRQLASTLAARRLSGVRGPVFGYLIGSPENAVLSEDPSDGFRSTAVAADSTGAVTAIGALMLPPGISDGRHIACGSFGSLSSFATSIPDGVPFLGVVAIAPDAPSQNDSDLGAHKASSSAASAFSAGENELSGSLVAADLKDSTFTSFVDENVRDNLEYWAENINILRGHPPSLASETASSTGKPLNGAFPLLVVLPHVKDAVIASATAPAGESKGDSKGESQSGVVYVNPDVPLSVNPACVRAFTITPPSEEELDAAYAMSSSNNDDVAAAAAADADNGSAIKVSPLPCRPLTPSKGVESKRVLLRRTLSLRVPSVVMAAGGTVGAGKYLREVLTSHPGLACLLSPASASASGGMAAVETPGLAPVLLSHSDQGPSVSAVAAAATAAAAAGAGAGAVDPDGSSKGLARGLSIVDVTVYTSTAASAPATPSVTVAAVPAQDSTFSSDTVPLAYRDPLTVTLTALACYPVASTFSQDASGSTGQSKGVELSLGRAVSRLHRLLQDQLEVIVTLLECPALLLHQSGLLLGNGSGSGSGSGGSGSCSGKGWPALALAPAPASALDPASASASGSPLPPSTTTPTGAATSDRGHPSDCGQSLRPPVASLLAKLLSPFRSRLPSPTAFGAAQAAHPAVLVPVSIDVLSFFNTSPRARGSAGGPSNSLWEIPFLAVVPRFCYDSEALYPPPSAGTPEAFGTAPAAAVAAEQAAAIAAAAAALAPAGAPPLPSPAAEGLPLTPAEAAAELRRALFPPPGEALSLLPAAAVVAGARDGPLKAAVTWRFGVLTAEVPFSPVEPTTTINGDNDAAAADDDEDEDELLRAGRLVNVHTHVPLPESFLSGEGSSSSKGVASSSKGLGSKGVSLSLEGDVISVALSTGASEFCHYGPLPPPLSSSASASASTSASASASAAASASAFPTDKGWGCAYRSLQTILSWYRRNRTVTSATHPHLLGPVALPAASPAAAACVGVPSHAAIQTALVALGDKPASLRGSSQWIGAFELALVLQGLYGIRAKLVPVASGAGVRAHARELVEHFSEQGAPVMVGGGELALTVVGVAVNEQSGDVRYLIMDPHYTGEDTVEAAVGEGKGRGCVWRGDEVWDKNAFYNILLPQKPQTRVSF